MLLQLTKISLEGFMAQKKAAAKKKTPLKKAAVKKAAASKKTSAKASGKKSVLKKKPVVRKPERKKVFSKKAGPAEKSKSGKAAPHKRTIKKIMPAAVEVLPKKPAVRAPITSRRPGLGSVIAKITGNRTKSAPKK